MPYWSVTIPTRTAYGGAGIQVFIVDADHAKQARGLALDRADLPKSRQRRSNAILSRQDLTVAEITACWGMRKGTD